MVGKQKLKHMWIITVLWKIRLTDFNTVFISPSWSECALLASTKGLDPDNSKRFGSKGDK